MSIESVLAAYNDPAPQAGPQGQGPSDERFGDAVAYDDSGWDDSEQRASEQTGVPASVIHDIRVLGERSNGNQVSPVGARGVYQFMPRTRDAFLNKYGVDAYSNNRDDQALAAALHLKESYDRTGDWGRAVAGYNGGISAEQGRNGTQENADYVRRVMNGAGPAGGPPIRPGSRYAELFNTRLAPESTPWESLIDENTGRSLMPPEPKPEPVKPDGVLGFLRNSGAQLMEGGLNLAGGLVSLPAPDSGLAQDLRDAGKWAYGLQTPGLRAALEETDKKAEAANAEAGGGIMGEAAEVGSRLKSGFANPAQLSRFAVTNIASIAPGLGAIKAVKIAGYGAKAAIGAASGVNAAVNAGFSRSDSYDALYRAYKAQGMSDDDAKAKAVDESKLATAVGGVTGALSPLYGVEAMIARSGTGAVSKATGLALSKVGMADVVGAATDTSLRNAAKQGLKVAAQEVLTELPENVLPNIATNKALDDTGTPTPWYQGTGRATAESVLGTVGFGAYGAQRHARETLRDNSVMDLLLNRPDTPAPLQNAARDRMADTARQQGVPENEVDAWMDQQFETDDARQAALDQQQAAADRQDAVALAVKGKLYQLGKQGRIDQELGIGQPGAPNTQADFEAALNEPTGLRVSDANGIERELTAGEDMLGPVERQPLERTEMGRPIVQADARQRARAKHGIVKTGAIETFADVDDAHVNGVIGDDQFDSMVMRLRGDAKGLQDVRGEIAQARMAEQRNQPPSTVTSDSATEADARAAMLQAAIDALGAPAADAAGPETPASEPAPPPVKSPIERLFDGINKRLTDAGKQPLTPLARGRVTLALGYNANGSEPSGMRTPRTWNQVAAAEAEDTGRKPVGEATLSGQMKALGITQKLLKQAFAVDIADTGMVQAQDMGEVGRTTNPDAAPAELTGELTQTDEAGNTGAAPGVREGFAETDAAEQENSEPGQESQRELESRLAEEPTYDPEADGARDAGQLDAETVAAEAERVQRDTGGGVLSNELRAALSDTEGAADAVLEAHDNWNEADDGRPKFHRLTIEQQAEYVKAWHDIKIDQSSEAWERLQATEDRLARKSTKDAEKADSAPRRVKSEEANVAPSEEAEEGEMPNPKWDGGTAQTAFDVRAQELAQARAAVPSIGKGVGDIPTGNGTARTFDSAPGSFGQKVLAAAISMVLKSKAGHAFRMASSRLKSLTYYVGDRTEAAARAKTDEIGVEHFGGLFSAEDNAVLINRESPLFSWVKNREFAGDGAADFARLLAHETTGHALDHHAGKELGLDGYATMTPMSPLRARAKVIPVKGVKGLYRVEFQLNPAVRELFDIYRGVSNGGKTNRGNVPGTAGALATQKAVGGTAAGHPHRANGEPGVTEAGRAGVQRALGETPGGRRDGAGAGADTADGQARPGRAVEQNERDASHGAKGNLGGLSLDQPFKRLLKLVKKAEDGEPFTTKEITEVTAALREATTESWAYLNEAGHIDLAALHEQAPQAAALLESVWAAQNLREVGRLLAGAEQAKAQPRGDAPRSVRPSERKVALPPKAPRMDTGLLGRLTSALRGRGDPDVGVVSADRLPSTLKMFGSNARPVTIDVEHIRHVQNTHPEITLQDIAALPGLLQHPRAILRHTEGLRVYLDARAENGNPLVVALTQARAREGGFKVTEVSTMFDRAESAREIVHALQDGRVEYLSKRSVARVQELLPTALIAAQSPNESGATASLASPAAPNHADSAPATTARAVSTQRENSIARATFYSDAAVAAFERGEPWRDMKETLPVTSDRALPGLSGVAFSKRKVALPPIDARLPEAAGVQYAAQQAALPGLKGRNLVGKQAVEHERTALARTASTWHQALHDLKGAALRNVAMLDGLVDAAKGMLPSARTYHELIRRAEADHVKDARAIDSIMDSFMQLPKHERSTDAGSLNKFLERSTVAKEWGFKPDWQPSARFDPNSESARLFNALSPAAQDVARRVFKHGFDEVQQRREVALASINDEADVLIHEARRRGDLAGARKLENEKLRRSNQFGTLADIDTSWPYTHLGRFGDFVVIARSARLAAAEAKLENASDDEAGQLRKEIKAMRQNAADFHVAFTETKGESRKLAEDLRRTGKFGLVENMAREAKSYGRQGDMIGLFNKLRDMADNVSDDKLAGAAGQSLRQLMADLNMSLLAEHSARQGDRHRETIAGYDPNIMRAFESHGRASAHFISAMRNAKEIQGSLTAMRREVRDQNGKGTVEERQDFYNEFLKRHMMRFDYRPNRLVGKMMAGTSLWQLVTSPAYHFYNATQPWVMSLPTMAGKHGYVRSAAELTRAYRDMATLMKSGFATNEDLAKAPADVRNALVELANQGRINISMESNFGRWGTDGNPTVVKAMRVTNRIAQSVEALNRVATAIAALRLEHRGAQGAIEADAGAMAFANEIIGQTHGDYTSANAPRFMQTNFGKLVTQFRKFQLIQLSLWTRLAYNSLRGESPEVRAVARKALAYNFATMGAISGMVGLPGFTLAAWLLDMAMGAFGDDDKRWDTEDEFKKLVGDNPIGKILYKGAPYASGVDMAHRIGAGEMLSVLPFTDIKASRDGWAAMVMGAMGPLVGGLAPRVLDGVGQAMKGNVWQGLEGLLPRGIADLSKGLRQGTQGATNRRGDSLMSAEDIGFLASIGQAAGFPTTTISDRGYNSNQVYQTSQFYKDRAAALTRQYTAAAKGGDQAKQAELRAAWLKLQATRAELGLKRQPMSSMTRAPVQQQQRERNTVGGVQYRKGDQQFVRSTVGQ